MARSSARQIRLVLGAILYLGSLGMMIAWFSWVLMAHRMDMLEELNRFYSAIFIEHIPINWNYVISWQYVVILPMHICSLGLSALFAIPFAFSKNTCYYSFGLILSLQISWMGGYLLLMVSQVYGNFTNEFESVMGGISSVFYFAILMLVFAQLKRETKRRSQIEKVNFKSQIASEDL